MRAWRPLTPVLLLALTLLVAAPDHVSAECDGPYPSFRSVAPGAERILIGEVVQVDPAGARHDDGRMTGFVLRGRSVLEGDRLVDEVFQDVPTQPCAGPIVARVGDVIAVAFRGHDFEPPQVVNAVAWIDGAAPELIGVEQVSVAEVYLLAGVPMPVPAEARVTDGAFPVGTALGLAAVVAAVLGAALVFRTLARRRAKPAR